MARAASENINHFHAVRMRVVGSGNLKLVFNSLDDVQSQTLVPIVMNPTTNIEPTRLANFVQQRAQLELRTTEIHEIFKINRILIFVKPIASEFPS